MSTQSKRGWQNRVLSFFGRIIFRVWGLQKRGAPALSRGGFRRPESAFSGRGFGRNRTSLGIFSRMVRAEPALKVTFSSSFSVGFSCSRKPLGPDFSDRIERSDYLALSACRRERMSGVDGFFALVWVGRRLLAAGSAWRGIGPGGLLFSLRGGRRDRAVQVPCLWAGCSSCLLRGGRWSDFGAGWSGVGAGNDVVRRRETCTEFYPQAVDNVAAPSCSPGTSSATNAPKTHRLSLFSGRKGNFSDPPTAARVVENRCELPWPTRH